VVHLVTHCGAKFDIGHLKQHVETCSWTGAAGPFTCSIKIRYSSHCYSIEHKGEVQPPDAFIFQDRKRTQVFSPKRHAHSIELPSILRDLCANPTHPISFTPEDNWTVFRLTMPSPLDMGEIFWIFFRLKLISGVPKKPSEVNLFVESAYPRKLRPKTIRPSMFGRVVENL
jgi:hypothetical protein